MTVLAPHAAPQFSWRSLLNWGPLRATGPAAACVALAMLSAGAAWLQADHPLPGGPSVSSTPSATTPPAIVPLSVQRPTPAEHLPDRWIGVAPVTADTLEPAAPTF